MITFSATLTCCYDAIFSPFSATDFEHGLAWLAHSGFDAAELCINDYDSLDGDALQQVLSRYKLGCSTIATGQARKRDGLSLLASDSCVVQRTQQRLCQHIDMAARLGSFVTVGSLRAVERTLTRESYLNELAENLYPCLNYARQKGVTLIFEAMNRYEISHLHSAQDMLDFIQFMDSPKNIGVLWDTFHANIEDPDFAAAINVMGNWLKHVHYSDSNRWFPGYGHLPLNDIYRALKASGYDGAISLECFLKPSAKTVINESRNWISWLRQL